MSGWSCCLWGGRGRRKSTCKWILTVQIHVVQRPNAFGSVKLDFAFHCGLKLADYKIICSAELGGWIPNLQRNYHEGQVSASGCIPSQQYCPEPLSKIACIRNVLVQGVIPCTPHQASRVLLPHQPPSPPSHHCLLSLL